MPNVREKAAERFWSWSIPQLAAQLTLDPVQPARGLGTDEAARRRAQHGLNEAVVMGHSSLLMQLAARFKNPLIIILLAASAMSALSGEVASFVIIVVVVLLGVGLDFVQEVRAERTAAALRGQVAVRSRVLRDGRECIVPAVELVPGDVVSLRAGDRIPADGRLLEARDFFLNQALLTGEPYPVEKHAGELAAEAVDPGSAANSVFLGSSVISGTGKVLIVRTGRATELGALASSLASKAPPTDFEVGTRQFGMLILRITLLLVLCVVLFNTLLHRPWLEALLFALALAVGLTPELLPMVSTVTLARGAVRLAASRVIVKRLASMHNYFETGLKSPLDEAILEHRQLDVSGWRKLDEVAFDFERRRVSVLAEDALCRWLIVKGAPEDLLKLCDRYLVQGEEIAPLDAGRRAEIMQLLAQLGDDGMRILGIAWHPVPPEHATAQVSDEAQLIFAGFAAFLDPPKASAATALQNLAQRGIDIRILTGDNERVTRHLCEQLGLPVSGTLTGDELALLSDEALQARLRRTNLFCRMTPQQKLRVLLALKRQGHVVGFLGDGRQ